LALAFAAEVGTWTLLGDAAECERTENQTRVIAALRQHGPMSPKNLAEIADINYETAKTTMRRMGERGDLHVQSRGVYALPVTPEPSEPLNLSPNVQGEGKVQGQDRAETAKTAQPSGKVREVPRFAQARAREGDT